MSEPEYTLPAESVFKKSKFNAAFLQFTRLNELWNDANNHSREGQFDKWNIDLDTIWNELIAHVGKEQASFDLISRDIKKYQNDSAVVYGLLRRKERMVRKLEDHSGKGTAYQDDDDDGMN